MSLGTGARTVDRVLRPLVRAQTGPFPTGAMLAEELEIGVGARGGRGPGCACLQVLPGWRWRGAWWGGRKVVDDVATRN